MSSTTSKDSKYFNPTKKGEIHELKQELDSGSISTKRECLKKIIAAMTIGKDVSMLFPQVVKQIQTTDLELKKLVYLYVMNYAKTQPDLAILSVNAFVQDSTKNRNPLVRALAIRTMGCIRVDKITEYLCQPLHQCLKDPDPYVRKTAAVCVAKLHDISPDLVERQGFLDMLVDLLSDSNPMVVANSVAALSEISENTIDIFRINAHNLNKLLAALNECTEWGQIFILNALASYEPRDSREAESISERVTARLQHSNSAVVLAAIRVLMKYLDHITSPEVVRALCKKMGAPLVTLLSKEPEIQYVALRNINLVLQKRPNILQHEMKVFFCKYNDPLYVKMEKLEIMITLATERNVEQVLMEFKEYATAADVEFVRKAVRAIGRAAIKLENTAERCIHVLLELIENGFNPVVQEAIIVIKDIFRKYPNKYESIIIKLCENLDTLDAPEARAAMIWIIGEYAERIGNADVILSGFLEEFLDEPSQVQLQLLTAIVKLFLKRPKNSKQLVLSVLNMATLECENPDIRDRGFVYWRLLTNPKAAKAVVLAEKPVIVDDANQMDPSVLETLISELGTLASVYHKPAETFVPKLRRSKAAKAAQELKQKKRDAKKAAKAGNSPQVPKANAQQTPDLLGGISAATVPANNNSSSSSGTIDLLGGLSEAPTPSAPQAPAQRVLLSREQGQGLEVSGEWARQNGTAVLSLNIANYAQTPLSNFAVQFNTNVFCIAPAERLSIPQLAPNQVAQAVLPISFAGQAPPAGTAPTTSIQCAIRDNRNQVFFWADNVPFELLFTSDGNVGQQEFLAKWRELTNPQNEVKAAINVTLPNIDAVEKVLNDSNIFTIAKRNLQVKDVLFLSLKVANKFPIYLEVALQNSVCSVTIKCQGAPLLPLALQAVKSVLG